MIEFREIDQIVFFKSQISFSDVEAYLEGTWAGYFAMASDIVPELLEIFLNDSEPSPEDPGTIWHIYGVHKPSGQKSTISAGSFSEKCGKSAQEVSCDLITVNFIQTAQIRF